MLSITVAVVLAGTTTWNARARVYEESVVTIFPARALAADAMPCRSDAKLTLIDERCTDVASNLALIASIKKEAPLKPLATVTTDAEGRFSVQVPPGRLLVRVKEGRDLSDYLVEPVAGVETVLSGGDQNSARELADDIVDRIDPRDARGDVWVVGQDNPQVVRLQPKDLKALQKHEWKGSPFFSGCSKIVSGKGRVLGATCAPAETRRRSDALAVELTGQVLENGKPRPNARVRQYGGVPSLSDSDGRFTLYGPLDFTTLIVAEAGGLFAAELIEKEWTLDGTSVRPVTLRLSRTPLPKLLVKDGDGAPVAGAQVRFWYRGRVVFVETDAAGEAIAPRSLEIAAVRITSPGMASFTGWLSLSKAPSVVLRPPRTVEARFISADGVVVRPDDVQCDTCDVVSFRPSRDGRVALGFDEEAVLVRVGTQSVAVSAGGVVVLPESRSAVVPTSLGDDEVVARWSTPTGAPAPGRQFATVCSYYGCQTRIFDVPDSGVVKVPPMEEASLEVHAKNFKAGTPMPTSVELSGPNLRGTVSGYFDRDGVARFSRLPPGPWEVQLDFVSTGVWCSAGKRCELDLSTPRRRWVQLRGDVASQVEVDSVGVSLGSQSVDVVDGGFEPSGEGRLVIDDTTLLVPDGGAQVVTLAPRTDVEVRVVDAQQRPVLDALVSIGLPGLTWLAGEQALTDERGVVVFKNQRPGNLPVRVAKAGYALATTNGTQAKNTVTLAPATTLVCRLKGAQAPVRAECGVSFDGGEADADSLRAGEVTLHDLPAKPVTVSLDVGEFSTGASWRLRKAVDLSTTREVTFELPRAGRVLVLPFASAAVDVPGVGVCRCLTLSEGFCETPPVPPGKVTVSDVSGERFDFVVPTGTGRTLVPVPEVRR